MMSLSSEVEIPESAAPGNFMSSGYMLFVKMYYRFVDGEEGDLLDLHSFRSRAGRY